MSQLSTLVASVPGAVAALNGMIESENAQYANIALRHVDYSAPDDWSDFVLSTSKIFETISTFHFDHFLQIISPRNRQLMPLEINVKYHNALCLFLLHFQFPCVLTNEFKFGILSSAISSALESRSALLVQSSLIILRRCLASMSKVHVTDAVLFQRLSDMTLKFDIKCVRLNGITLLSEYLSRLSRRALYSLFLKVLPKAHVKVAAFLIPHVKNFLLAESDMNCDLLWSLVLSRNPTEDGDIVNSVDRTMPTLALVRCLKMAGKCPAHVEPDVARYLGALSTEVAEGRKFYEIELESAKSEHKQRFFDLALLQVDFVNSQLKLARELFNC